MNTIIDRLLCFMDKKGINDNQMTVSAGLSIGLIGKAKKANKGLSSDSIEKILQTYMDLSAEWLLLGKGEMLKTNVHPLSTPELPMSMDQSIYYKLYKEERVKVEAQAEEIGRLKQELECLKIEISGKKITEKPTSASATPTSRSSRSGNYPADSVNVLSGTK